MLAESRMADLRASAATLDPVGDARPGRTRRPGSSYADSGRCGPTAHRPGRLGRRRPRRCGSAPCIARLAGRRRRRTMPAMTATTDRLPFTGDDAADRLLVTRPARAADRLRARPAGHRPEGVQRPARARSAGSATSMPRGSRRPTPRSSTPSSASRRRCIASRAPWPARSSSWRAAIATDYGNDAAPDLDGGDRRPRPQAPPARPCPASAR